MTKNNLVKSKVVKTTKLQKVIFAVLFLLLPTVSIAQTANDLDSQAISTLTENNENSAVTVLNKMRHAVTNTNYQIFFSIQNFGEYTNTFKYEHIKNETGNSARLVFLEGVNKEIILHDNIVSYLQSSESISFSITASHIIEAYPEIVYNDFDQLTNYYDLILIGKAKTADRSSLLVRVVSKDKDRYHYVLWIDEESYLPLRIDLLGIDSQIIKQFKVISLNTDYDFISLEEQIQNQEYPILFPIEKEDSDLDDWHVTWLPTGFKEIASYNINFYHSDIDTRLYSDGLFSFTVNVSEKTDSKSAHVIEQGGRNIYTTNLNDMNIVVIGNLPVDTIEKVALSIKRK